MPETKAPTSAPAGSVTVISAPEFYDAVKNAIADAKANASESPLAKANVKDVLAKVGITDQNVNDPNVKLVRVQESDSKGVLYLGKQDTNRQLNISKKLVTSGSDAIPVELLSDKPPALKNDVFTVPLDKTNSLTEEEKKKFLRRGDLAALTDPAYMASIDLDSDSNAGLPGRALTGAGRSA